MKGQKQSHINLMKAIPFSVSPQFSHRETNDRRLKATEDLSFHFSWQKQWTKVFNCFNNLNDDHRKVFSTWYCLAPSCSSPSLATSSELERKAFWQTDEFTIKTFFETAIYPLRKTFQNASITGHSLLLELSNKKFKFVNENFSFGNIFVLDQMRIKYSKIITNLFIACSSFS